MNDNDILIARQEGGTVKTVVVDGDVAEFERMERRKKERQQAEDAKRKQEADYARQRQLEKAAIEQAEFARRRRQVCLVFGLLLSVGGLMALTLTNLMHTVVGMAFISGAATTFGWMLGRNK